MRLLLDKIAVFWALLGGAILIAIVLVTVTNVGAFTLDRIARVVGGTVRGLPGYEDFVRLAISCAGLMLFPYCQSRRGHIAVDMFVNLTPPRAQRALDRTSQVGIAVLALFLAYWMALGLEETRADGVLSPVLGWLEWPFYVPGIISLLLWATVTAVQIFECEPRG